MNSRTDFSGVGILRNERIPPPGGWPKAEIVAAPDLPGSMKFALLYMRRNVDELTGKVVTAMRAMGAEWSVSDLHHLVALGFMEQQPGSHHVLTDAGKRESMKIARDLARKYPVHVVSFREGVPNTNMGPWASCSCGDWNDGQKHRNAGILRDNAAKHLEAVASGKWRKLRTMDEIIAEVDARKKNLVHEGDRRVLDLGIQTG